MYIKTGNIKWEFRQKSTSKQTLLSWMLQEKKEGQKRATFKKGQVGSYATLLERFKTNLDREGVQVDDEP